MESAFSRPGRSGPVGDPESVSKTRILWSARYQVLRVFTSPSGLCGNPLAVFLAGQSVPASERQRVAQEIGFSETVFVDGDDLPSLEIFGPQRQLAFAGHPLVGTSWLLRGSGRRIEYLRPPVGAVPTFRNDDGTTWIRARPEWIGECSHIQLDSVSAVEAAAIPPGHDFIQVWAWADESAGVVRARMFAPRDGVAEDEACGVASMVLASKLQRDLEVRHGRGSIVLVRLHSDGTADVGGHVAVDEEREYRRLSVSLT